MLPRNSSLNSRKRPAHHPLISSAGLFFFGHVVAADRARWTRPSSFKPVHWLFRLPMPPVPYIPSRGDRLNAVTHVVHEYANLVSAAHYSMHGDAPWRSHCDDAFLLGCRKMDDFLMRTQR